MRSAVALFACLALIVSVACSNGRDVIKQVRAGKGPKCCDEYVCLSVCVCPHNSETARPNFTKCLCMLPGGRGSVLL